MQFDFIFILQLEITILRFIQNHVLMVHQQNPISCWIFATCIKDEKLKHAKMLLKNIFPLRFRRIFNINLFSLIRSVVERKSNRVA